VLSLVMAMVVTVDPCELPAGTTLEAQLHQLLPRAAAAPEIAGASPQLVEVFKQARQLRLTGGSKAKVMATLDRRLELLEQVLSLCSAQLPQRLSAVRVMVALVLACDRDPDFFHAFNRTLPAARSVAKDFPASAAAQQVLASVLDPGEKWGSTPERRVIFAREKKLAIESCHELDPQLSCVP
jgi:hypothetical protein